MGEADRQVVELARWLGCGLNGPVLIRPRRLYGRFFRLVDAQWHWQLRTGCGHET
jgi:hypothetical protein